MKKTEYNVKRNIEREKAMESKREKISETDWGRGVLIESKKIKKM